MSDGSPWADPHAPTERGAPYAGPPPTDRPVPPPYGVGYHVPPYGPPGYPGYPPYGYPPPWPGGPRPPGRPGQVIAAAVLAFVQGGLVLLSSVYVVFLSSFLGFAVEADPSSAPGGASGLATEGTVLGLVQVGSAVLLVVAGVLVLNSRRPRALVVLVIAFAVQVLLCVYWAVRLTVLADDIPGADPAGAFLAFTLLFAAGPVVGLGLVLVGSGRRWFAPAPSRGGLS
jgi:hypothetical protein